MACNRLTLGLIAAVACFSCSDDDPASDTTPDAGEALDDDADDVDADDDVDDDAGTSDDDSPTDDDAGTSDDDTGDDDADDAGPGVGADSGANDDPGALLAVNMSSTVGVLLDEIPEAVRDEAAARILAEGDDFFIARAHRQIDYTYYRLSFRQFFYEEGAAMQLPLPPEDIWQVTLTSEPERRTIDGHDVIAIDYDFSTTILAQTESVEVSEAALAVVGGTWNEPFLFPVDPELFFQRTGYACMDEADFPPNPVDGENAWQFYDQTCEFETEDTVLCHVTELPVEGCVEALEDHVGMVETELQFERLGWDEALADEVRSGKITNEVGADLEVYVPGLQNNRVIYRYFEPDSCALAEGCVGGPGWRRLLQFDAISHNVGAGPMHIGDVDYYLEGDGGEVNEHNLYEFSACHEHYHFSHYGSFYYGEDDEAVGGKRAFCLESTNRLSNNEVTPLWSPYGFCEYQGIEAGWGDMYQAGLDCQWVDVTDIDSPATAPLTSHANPDDLLCEGVPSFDEDGAPVWASTELTTEAGEPIDTIECDAFPDRAENNRDSVDMVLPGPGLGLITTECSRGQVGPRKDCGFALVGELGECTSSESTTIQCTVPEGEMPVVVRVCEASQVLGVGTACTYRDSLANESLVDGTLEVTFDCPYARDDSETGGSYALYAGALLPGDTLGDVECVVVP
jgi:hypothetical protein